MRHIPIGTFGAAAAAALLAACASDSSRSGAELVAADFRSADAGAAAAARPTASTPPAAMSERGTTGPKIEEMPVDPGASPIEVIQGAPHLAAATGSTTPGGEPVVMDALIGDINGTPVYASEFFSVERGGVGARLAGLAAKYHGDSAAWKKEAMQIIGGKLGEMVRDEVLLAEARSSLSPEQKQGLLAFIEQVRRDLVSRGGGGKAAVDENLREAGENGLEATLKKNIDRQLIYSNIREKIMPRASVSWHDVQVEYDRRAEKFNPDPTAHFNMIWLPADKPDLIEQFKSELSKGTSFEELAARPENEYFNEKSGAAAQVFKGDYSKAELFGPAELNTPARELHPGETAGPITFGKHVAWIHLNHIETPKAKSIYEAQLEIYNELREERLKTESDKYLHNLLDQQSYTALADMADKLLVIATERYFGDEH